MISSGPVLKKVGSLGLRGASTAGELNSLLRLFGEGRLHLV